MIERVIELLQQVPGDFAFWMVIILLLICGIGLPLPEEIPLIAAGYLVHLGVVSLERSILFCLLAIWIGDSAIFFLGRKLGSRIFDIPFFKNLLTPERMERVNHYFHRYGSGMVFVARFMAGVRATSFLSAGILRMSYRRFLLLDGTATLISVPLNIWLASYFGSEIDEGVKIMRQMSRTLLSLILIAVVGAFLFLYWRRKRTLRDGASS